MPLSFCTLIFAPQDESQRQQGGRHHESINRTNRHLSIRRWLNRHRGQTGRRNRLAVAEADGRLIYKDVRTINEHVINVFEEGELAREATIRNFRIVRQEGQRQVEREIEHYNLDVIISVGYRVNSRKGTQFRTRRALEVPGDAPAIEQAKAALAQDWPRFVVMEVDQALVERAGNYADTFALRGYDSIQLAAAFEAGRIAQSPICFACFDARLNKAADVLGMACL